MSFVKKIPKFIFILNLILLDVSVSYLVYVGFFQTRNETSPEFKIFEKPSLPADTDSEECGEGCREYIDQKITQLLEEKAATPTPTKTTQVTNASKVRRVAYVPIPGSGSTLKTEWTTLAGTDFYLSKSDYPGLLGVYFEANMKLISGNGAAFVRLYDNSHGIAVVGSELQTSSQTSTFVSGGPISLWEGYNNYQIQAKSLTADTTVFESGRIKIVTEE